MTLKFLWSFTRLQSPNVHYLKQLEKTYIRWARQKRKNSSFPRSSRFESTPDSIKLRNEATKKNIKWGRNPYKDTSPGSNLTGVDPSWSTVMTALLLHWIYYIHCLKSTSSNWGILLLLNHAASCTFQHICLVISQHINNRQNTTS